MEDNSVEKCFNLYYLNLSKVYELSMMINNTIMTNVQRERNNSKRLFKNTKASIGGTFQTDSDYLASIKSVIESNKSSEYTSSAKIIENLDLFKNGYFTIQDMSAGLTAKILNPKPDELVLDACSAPGGKTTYMAELMNNKGKIEAWDIHEHRTKLVEQNAKRLGIDIISTQVKDASIYDEKLTEKFDKILLDVPCLGIGVIKRKPDIKWQRKIEDVEEITTIQKTILENCSKYLKKGGELVYSTCSILKEENEEVISKFLTKNKNFVINENGIINIFTDEEKDGFFICKLHKK